MSRADLRLRVPVEALRFSDTSELVQQPLPWIGQDRAEQAARFGLGLEHPGYNLFVLGAVGSGRFLEKMRPLEHVMNEALASLCRQSVKPLLDHELQEIRHSLKKQIKDSVKLGAHLDQVLHDVLENVQLFTPVDDEDAELALLSAQADGMQAEGAGEGFAEGGLLARADARLHAFHRACRLSPRGR